MNSTEILAAYRSISGITGEMAEAARSGEWDKLTALERQCATLVARFGTAQTVRFTNDERRQKVELLHKILADDVEIRRHTEPWMERVQAILGNAGMQRRLRRAYDSGAGDGAST